MTTFDETVPNPGILPYRVGQLESFRRDTDEWRRDVDKDRESLSYMRDDIKTIKRVAIGLLVSFVTGSASVTIAVLLSTKH